MQKKYKISARVSVGTHINHFKQAMLELSSTLNWTEFYPKFKKLIETKHQNQIITNSGAILNNLNFIQSAFGRRFGLGLGNLERSLWLYEHFDATSAINADVFIGFALGSYNALISNKKNNIPNILEVPTAHINEFIDASGNDPKLQKRSKLRKMAIKEYEEADYINTLSQYARDSFLERGYDPRKITATLLPINSTYWQRTDESHNYTLDSSADFKVCFVGRIERAKGIDILTKVWKRVSLRNSLLYIVGRETDQELSRELFGNTKTIIKTGAVSKAELRSIYQQCDVMIFPTRSDGFGLVILEAMSSGIPVFASTKSAAPDIITNQSDGLLFDHNDEDTLADYLLWASKNKIKIQQMGQKALIRSKYFSISKYVSDWSNILDRIT